MWEAVQRDAIYIWGYFDIQLRQISGYWAAGILAGSVISVFAKGWLQRTAAGMGRRLPCWLGLAAMSALGIASPLCMYGTIPVCAAFARQGMRQEYLASFMMGSILLNPQLVVYSAALGWFLLAVRILSAWLCGIAAGALLLVFPAGAGSGYFSFSSFDSPSSRDTAASLWLRLLFNIGRNLRATAPWFLLGILLSALFQHYIPASAVVRLFGRDNEGFGVLMAATVGVPLYVCGGGTIPLLLQWMQDGMGCGAAAAFMITGPATKITNLGALKIVLGTRQFMLYLAFSLLYALCTGVVTNLIAP